MNFNTKVTISYYQEGSRNDFGEPSRTLTTRASNVPAVLDPRSPKIRFEFPFINLRAEKQGRVFIPTNLLMVKRSQAISNGDIITDVDGNTFIVARVESVNNSHKEAILGEHQEAA